VKGTTITITVPSTTRILLKGVRKTLADLAVGYRITVTGTRTGSIYTAARVEATKNRAKPAPSASTPAPSDSASPAPTHSATPDPSPSTSPAADPSA
jgi:hypothetical protein